MNMNIRLVLVTVAVFAAGTIHVNAADIPDSDGQKIYQNACAMCHKAGNAGAPKVGDVAAWEVRIAQGIDVLYEHSIKGFKGSKGTMPPKGGQGALGDAEVMAAVDYMVGQSSKGSAP